MVRRHKGTRPKPSNLIDRIFKNEERSCSASKVKRQVPMDTIGISGKNNAVFGGINV